MTKTIIIGEIKPETTNRPIEFNYVLTNLKTITPVDGFHLKPNTFRFIELIAKNYLQSLDLMFAYNENGFREKGVLFIGKWNDGIV